MVTQLKILLAERQLRNEIPSRLCSRAVGGSGVGVCHTGNVKVSNLVLKMVAACSWGRQVKRTGSSAAQAG